MFEISNSIRMFEISNSIRMFEISNYLKRFVDDKVNISSDNPLQTKVNFMSDQIFHCVYW